MKLGLFGFGKAGRSVATVILNNKQNILQWVIRKSKTLDRRSAPEFLGLKSDEPGLIYSKEDSAEVFSTKQLLVDGIIDFSSADSVYTYGNYARENRIAIITAISHYEPKEILYLRELAKDTRVLWSPNITVGINFLMIAAKVLQTIAPYADIEIIEEHFKKKPEVSGTAKKIATKLDVPSEQIKTIRAGGIIGKHEILFGFPFQTVRLTHESIMREAFGNGALFAFENIFSKENGLYSMEDIIKPYFAQ